MARDYLAESDLLRRLVGALGVRLVVQRDNRHLLVSNLSMSLDADEAALVAGVIRGGQ